MQFFRKKAGYYTELLQNENNTKYHGNGKLFLKVSFTDPQRTASRQKLRDGPQCP